MYKIETTPEFEKDINNLSSEIALRILNKLQWLSSHPEILRYPLKNLPKDLKNLQKYRIGDYRILLWVDHSRKTVTLYGVEHRRSIYKRLK